MPFFIPYIADTSHLPKVLKRDLELVLAAEQSEWPSLFDGRESAHTISALEGAKSENSLGNFLSTKCNNYLGVAKRISDK